jgi:16S rRNA (guanine527-N7)-methyltransferase
VAGPIDGQSPTDGLRAALTSAQELGFLGAPPIDQQIAHSRLFAALLPPSVQTVADLGSGGGLPGLVLAETHPELRLCLIESSERRADHLRRAVRRLDLDERVEVDARPAEHVARDPRRRAAFDAVVARSFGAPAVVAECAAPLLRPGGVVVVAEPEEAAGDRWRGLADTDLPIELDHLVTTTAGPFARLRLCGRVPDRYPRSGASLRSRPLFT